MSQNNSDQSTSPLTVRPAIVWTSVLVGVGVAVVVLLAWYILEAQERSHINRETVSTTRGVEALIRQDIERRVSLLTTLANRYSETTPLSRENWEAASRDIYQAHAGYRAIAWIDSSLHIRWLTPMKGNESVLGFDLGSNPTTLLAAQTARDKREIVFSTSFDPILGEQGLVVYVPLYSSGYNLERFDGLILSVLQTDTLLAGLIPVELIAEHDLVISVNGRAIYATHIENLSAGQQWKEQRQFDLYNLKWQVDIVPHNELVTSMRWRFSNLLLAAGLLLSALISLTVYSVMIARDRAHQAYDTARQLELLFKNLPGMAYRCAERDPWPMEFVSDGCSELSGYDRRDLEQQKILWGELVHPDDREYVRFSVQEAVTKWQAFEFEYRIRTRSGTEKWVWERGRGINQSGGKNVQLEGFICDITDRKLAKLAMIEARAFSEAVVDTAVEAVITIDASGNIETFNRAARQMFDYSLDEVQGRNVEMLIPEPYRAGHNSFISHYLETREARIIGSGRDLNARRKDGSVFPIHLLVSKIESLAEDKFVGLIRDISLQRQIEVEIREHREQLAHSERLNTLGEMATGIAHEINQPLTAISLFAQAGKRLLESGNQVRLPDIFDKVSQHAQRAGAVIERMQTMARQQDSDRDVVDCNTLVRGVISLAEADARIRDIIIEAELGDGLPLIYVDSVQIQQVALNLLRNGMEAMQLADGTHGDTIKIRTRLCDDDGVEVAVIDNGCGVSEEAAKKLFTPFATTKESGMGMGLSISQSIIRAHGGQLDFQTNQSGGTTFYFILPAAAQGDLDV